MLPNVLVALRRLRPYYSTYFTRGFSFLFFFSTAKYKRHDVNTVEPLFKLKTTLKIRWKWPKLEVFGMGVK